MIGSAMIVNLLSLLKYVCNLRCLIKLNPETDVLRLTSRLVPSHFYVCVIRTAKYYSLCLRLHGTMDH